MDNFSNNHLHLVSFWERYCDLSLATCVAKFFAAYWREMNEWYSKTHPHLHYSDEMAEYDAFYWGRANFTRLRELPWQSSESHPAEKVVPAISHAYGSTIQHFAESYLKQAGQPNASVPLVSNRYALSEGVFFLRGMRLGEQKTLHQMLGAGRELLSQNLRWGPLQIAASAVESSHFCVSGITRSGKTTMLLLLAQSVLDNKGGSLGRAIFYDAKNLLLSRLVRPGRNPLQSFHLLNPFDKRGVAWDIAADVNTQHRAKEIAAILFPMHHNDKSFFVDSSRRLATAVIDVLNETVPNDWNFLDLLVSLRPANLYRVLNQSVAGRECIAAYLPPQSISTPNLLATIDSRIDPFIPIAAAWSKAKEKVSLREWVKSSNKSLLLGHSHSHQLAMSRVNRVLVRILSDALLDATISKPTRTYIFLDELELLGRIDALPDLLNMGAELGVTMALGFHDLGSLRASYGDQTEGMLAMCSNMALLRTNSRSTAAWAADLLGQQDVAITKESRTVRMDNGSEEHPSVPFRSVSTSEQTIRQHVVSTNDMFELPLTTPEHGLTGYFSSHLYPAYRGHIEGKKLFPSTQQFDFRDPLQGSTSATSVSKAEHLLWEINGEPPFVPRDQADFEVSPTAVPSFADAAFLAAEPQFIPAAVQQSLETPLQSGDSPPPATSANDDDDGNDIDDLDILDVPWTRLPELDLEP